MVSKKGQLVEYLTAVQNLEQHKCTIEQTIKRLNYKINSLGHPEEVELKQVTTHKIPFLPISVFTSLIFLAAGLYRGFIFSSFKRAVISAFFLAPVGIIIGLVIALVVFLADKAITSITNKNCKKICHALFTADEARVSHELEVKSKICADVALLKESYNDVVAALQGLYSIGVLDPKYHGDLAAIATMREYLVSGKCQGLVINGNDVGAYRIYKDRLLQHKIIGKLDEILRSPEKIKQNQFALYEAVQSSKRQIRELTNSVATAAAHLEQSQDVADYHNAIQNQCTAETSRMQRNEYNIALPIVISITQGSMSTPRAKS